MTLIPLTVLATRLRGGVSIGPPRKSITSVLSLQGQPTLLDRQRRSDPRGKGRGTVPGAGPGVGSRASRSRAWRQTFFLMAVARRCPRTSVAQSPPHVPSPPALRPAAHAPHPAGPQLPRSCRPPSPTEGYGQRQLRTRNPGTRDSPPPCHLCPVRTFFQNFGPEKLVPLRKRLAHHLRGSTPPADPWPKKIFNRFLAGG